MQERLKLLFENNVIDREVFDFCSAAVSQLSGLGYQDGEMEAFITHLALSAMRIKAGKCVSCDAAAMAGELKEDCGEEVFSRAEALWEQIPTGSLVYNAEERCYVLLHLCTMISGKNQE